MTVIAAVEYPAVLPRGFLLTQEGVDPGDALIVWSGEMPDDDQQRVIRLLNSAFALMIVRGLRNPFEKLTIEGILREALQYVGPLPPGITEQQLIDLASVSPEILQGNLSSELSQKFGAIEEMARLKGVPPAAVFKEDDLYFEFLASSDTPNSYARQKLAVVKMVVDSALNTLALAMQHEGIIDSELSSAQRLSALMYEAQHDAELRDAIDAMRSVVTKKCRSKTVNGIIRAWGMHEIDLLDDDVRRSIGLLPAVDPTDHLEHQDMRHQAIEIICKDNGWDISSLTTRQQLVIYERMGIIFTK